MRCWPSGIEQSCDDTVRRIEAFKRFHTPPSGANANGEGYFAITEDRHMAAVDRSRFHAAYRNGLRRNPPARAAYGCWLAASHGGDVLPSLRRDASSSGRRQVARRAERLIQAAEKLISAPASKVAGTPRVCGEPTVYSFDCSNSSDTSSCASLVVLVRFPQPVIAD